jgi:hypothetical protein
MADEKANRKKCEVNEISLDHVCACIPCMLVHLSYTEKNCGLIYRELTIARNGRYIKARERFAFIMLQSFMSLT